MCSKAFLVREMRGGKKSNLKKIQKSPKKFKKVQKISETSLRRLKTPT
jgi:hypothetical protein